MAAAESGKDATRLEEHIIEIVSDSGEGAQTAGQMFGTILAKSGNSVWTVEIIPAEIEPPARAATASAPVPFPSPMPATAPTSSSASTNRH